MYLVSGDHQCWQKTTDISHIRGFCHPILCSRDPSSCDLWRQAPILFFVPFPVLSALTPLAMFHFRFLSNSQWSHWGAAPGPLTSAPVSHQALPLPLSTRFPPCFNSQNIQLHYFYPCSFLHSSVNCFPFQTFLLLADFLTVLHKAPASVPESSLESPHCQSPALSTVAQHELLYCWAVNWNKNLNSQRKNYF